MVANQPWSGLHDDLLAAKALVYDPSGFVCSPPLREPESADHAACGFTLDGLSVRYRVARTTPTKAGQFVTVWQRSEQGPIRPFDTADEVDLFVIGSHDDDGFGQFVFPREALCERGVVSRDGVGGKRGIRVYPPWVSTAGRQARATQAWQMNYFFHLDKDGRADLARAHELYRP